MGPTSIRLPEAETPSRNSSNQPSKRRRELSLLEALILHPQVAHTARLTRELDPNEQVEARQRERRVVQACRFREARRDLAEAGISRTDLGEMACYCAIHILGDSSVETAQSGGESEEGRRPTPLGRVPARHAWVRGRPTGTSGAALRSRQPGLGFGASPSA